MVEGMPSIYLIIDLIKKKKSTREFKIIFFKKIILK